MDNEAGMEHLSRRTTNNMDFLMTVVNPTLPSIRAARRILAISRQLPIRIEHRTVVVDRAGVGRASGGDHPSAFGTRRRTGS